MADGRHLEKLKNLNIITTDCPVLTNFDSLMRLDLSTPIANKISQFQKYMMAVAAILKFEKLQYLRNDKTDFDKNLVQWCVWPFPTPSANKILQIQQLKITVAAILKNRKIIISSQTIDRFWRNLACWCVSTLSIPIANKIWRFSKVQDCGGGYITNSKKSQYLRNGTTDFNKIWYCDGSGPPDSVSH